MAATTTFKSFDETDESDNEFTPLYDDDEQDHRTAQETKGWNLFREIPVKKESGSMVSTDWVELSVKILKVLAYIFVFIFVLGSAVIAKGTLLFITSQLKKGREIVHCNKILALDQQFITVLTLEERITWLWAAFMVFAAPELGVFLRSIRICFFKSFKKPDALTFFVAFILDTLHTIGMAILVLLILPELDVVKGAMLMNAMCVVPGVLNAFSRDPLDSRYSMKLIFDVVAVSMQLTAFVVWPLKNGEPVLWSMPVACVLVSLGWWENFIDGVDKDSSAVMLYLQDLRESLKRTRYATQRYLSLWKIVVFMAFIMISLHLQEDDPLSFFTKCAESFSDRLYNVSEIQVLLEDVYNGIVEYEITGEIPGIEVQWSTSLWVALIQIILAYVCFGAAKFACKILIQNFSFTFALTLVGPVTVNLLIVFCGLKNTNPCAFYGMIPDYVFFDMPPVYLLREYVSHEMAWVWVLWLVSQAWICMHAWQPSCERLASTDKLFARPWYSGPLIDQSLLMNRTKDKEVDIAIEDLKGIGAEEMSVGSSEHMVKDVKPTDSITRIYVCATMWHETKDEMIEFLKSVIRIDEDQSARRVAQKYLGIVDPDYYEFEANIFMDDAYEISDHSTEDMQVNRFVKCLVDTVDDAASEVHLTNVRLRAPKKYPTPYGGKLEWTLPGKNKLICHLKDKSKIRHRKRWSQVMYMYYFLGHRLMDLPISVDRKEVIAENTYLLALDGDIDFKPNAVTLLIDLMKKDKNLGAACGRIHPVGSGFMAWYQMFEYAIGHWLQKATEHMIGCVLCSPGCFSLFRGKALMDDNVMRKYTLTSSEARHYVQYDQGEDRWLCTLLLQRGYRVEYSAASDAYTHCPELFDEFFNQRRRWVPSTMANIFDLLADSKRTVAVNDNISTIYIVYQSLLMVGSILGPGTIFLMMVGAMNAITGMSNWNALIFNLVPILLYIVVCMTCKSQTQLMLASMITCAYAMIMVIVIVGIALQIVEDGWMAPSSMFFVLTMGSFFITGILHPQEIICLLYLIIYYITIPSMYMLLIIYSICNLNNVTWGTRETVEKKSPKEIEMERKEAEEAKKKAEAQGLLKWFGAKTDETKGNLEFSVSGLFKCICCTNPKDHQEDLHLLKIANSIEKIEKKLESLGAPEVPEMTPRRLTSIALRKESVALIPEYEDSEISTEIPKEERDPLINPYWIEDPNLQKGEVDFLTTAEIEFWNDLIDMYLRPIDENKAELARITHDLKNLRNTMVFAFIMLNALFVLVVFLLQLNQDQLHLKWPLGQKVSITYDDDMNMVTLQQDYLTLEPIGSLFVVFFGTVMLIQFSAMLMHRMGTLTHLLATTNLNWYFTKRPGDMTDDALLEKHAVEIVKDLQRLNTDDLEPRGLNDDHVSRRKTLHNLERARDAKQSVINLDANFKRRITLLQKQDPEILKRLSTLGGNEAQRRATLRALTTRRDSVLAEKRRSQLQAGNDASLYHMPDMGQMSGLGRPSASGVYMNRGYEPAFDSDEEDTPRPRRSTVRFREHYA